MNGLPDGNWISILDPIKSVTIVFIIDIKKQKRF